MEYVTLGKTGLRVSRMGLGGIPIQKIDAEGTKTLLHKLADRSCSWSNGSPTAWSGQDRICCCR